MTPARRPLLTGLCAEHGTDSRHHHLESGVCQRQLLGQQPAAASQTNDLTSKACFLAGRTCEGVPARAYLRGRTCEGVPARAYLRGRTGQGVPARAYLPGLHFDRRPRSLNREQPMQLQGAAYFPES